MASLLLIEDSGAHRAEIRRAVQAARLFDHILEAADGLCGLKMLVSEEVDVVLCDLELPGVQGEKLLAAKNGMEALANVPFIVLSADDDADRRVRVLELGAADAITKPFHDAELIARLSLHLKLKRLQDELREKNIALEKLSTMDAVTGLRTRRYVMEVLSLEFLRSRRYGGPLSVMMADLDHFKAVNDRFGHPAGDAVLRGVAGTLLSSLRATDTPGRYGGEEILVILTQNDAAGTRALAERWRALVEATSFGAPGGERISATVSIGIAEYCPDQETPEDLVAAADKALYRAKRAGRNRVAV